MPRWSLALALVGCGSSPSAPAAPHAAPVAQLHCGKLAFALDRDATLLAGRLAYRGSSAARSEPRAFGIMDAPKPPEQEERAMIGGGASAGAEPGDDAFVIFAEETWQLDPDRAKAEPDAVVHPGSLADEAPRFLRAIYGDEVEVAPIALGDPAIRAFAARPMFAHVEDGADHALVLGLLLALPDATLQTVSFDITPGLVPDAASCTTAAEQIAATLRPGPRRLVRAAGTRTLLAPFTVTVPEDYVVVHQPGPDFDRYELHPLRPLSLYPGSLTIAFDSSPDRTTEGPASEPGTLLGKPVTWTGERSDRGGMLVATQPDGASFVQVVVVATRQAKYLDQFRKVAETLRR
ncbi:MAG TPA: hypothetical protein VLX92_04095 [Kofleriaceae bacterium]|nr:hypothetical protein [Kofleriaceae bacterium]